MSLYYPRLNLRFSGNNHAVMMVRNQGCSSPEGHFRRSTRFLLFKIPDQLVNIERAIRAHSVHPPLVWYCHYTSLLPGMSAINRNSNYYAIPVAHPIHQVSGFLSEITVARTFYFSPQLNNSVIDFHPLPMISCGYDIGTLVPVILEKGTLP